MPNVHGDTQGLKASQIQALTRLYRRRVLPAQIIGDIADLTIRIARRHNGIENPVHIAKIVQYDRFPDAGRQSAGGYEDILS